MDLEQNSKLLREPHELEFKQKRRKGVNFCCTMTLTGAFFVLLLIASQVIFSTTHQPPKLKDSNIKHLRYEVVSECGKSREEAIERGCIFDVMAVEWIPKACYDPEYAQEAEAEDTMLAHVGASGVFPWFEDVNRTVPIAQEDLGLAMRDDLTAYTDETFHVAHCLYSWRSLAKATRNVMWGHKDVYISGAILGEDHINHCNMVIGDQKHRMGGKAQVTFGLGQCLRFLL